MRFQTRDRHIIHMIFPVSLLFVFAASSFMILMLAADIYSSTIRHLQVNDESRTALSYISEKIRQNDRGGNLTITDIGGIECLSMSNNYNGSIYVIYIYEYEGMLKELFIKEGAAASLKDGSDIIEISSLSIKELEENIYQFTVIDSEGFESTMIASERSSK